MKIINLICICVAKDICNILTYTFIYLGNCTLDKNI